LNAGGKVYINLAYDPFFARTQKFLIIELFGKKSIKKFEKISESGRSDLLSHARGETPL